MAMRLLVAKILPSENEKNPAIPAPVMLLLVCVFTFFDADAVGFSHSVLCLVLGKDARW